MYSEKATKFEQILLFINVQKLGVFFHIVWVFLVYLNNTSGYEGTNYLVKTHVYKN